MFITVGHVAADALDWCTASRAGPLALEGIREQFLPDCAFRGRQNKKLQFAVLAAAAGQSPSCSIARCASRNFCTFPEPVSGSTSGLMVST